MFELLHEISRACKVSRADLNQSQPFVIHAADGDRRPRVAFIDHTARRSGGEVALIRMIEALGDSIECHVILGEQGPIQADLENSGAEVHLLPMPSFLRERRKESLTLRGILFQALSTIPASVRYVRSAVELLKSLDVDVVHTNSLKSDLLGGIAGRFAGQKVVWHVRDMIQTPYLTKFGVILMRVGAYLIPHQILVNSKATQLTLPRLSTPRVVYNSVIYDAVPASEDSFTPTVKESSSEAQTIGIVGRIAPWKGQDVFLRAFAGACKESAHRAVIIGGVQFGEDSYLRDIKLLTDSLGVTDQVTFVGHTEDVHAALAKLDIFVHASTSPEPFGQVIVEAQLAGIPVIAAAQGGPLEIVSDGIDGLLVKPGDVSGYSRAIAQLLEDTELRMRLSEAGRLSAKRFSPEALRESLLGVYRQLLADRAVDA